MIKEIPTLIRAAVASLLCVLPLVGQSAPYKDRLDIPAEMTPRAVKSELYDVTHIVGTDTCVAVGERGHILRSTDKGVSWLQLPSPLSSPLLAVQFPTAQSGWLVGHDGVVMHSKDGGMNWAKQLDGRMIGEMMVAWYERQPVADDPAIIKALEEAKQIKEEGPSRPFLDVYFENDMSGWVIGSFNLILRTIDGGKTWEPWQHRMDNPEGHSLHAIAAVDGEVFIVGELGLLQRLDRTVNRFVAVKTPYPGSFFHLTGKPGVLLAYGLRGNIVRSKDRGATWQSLKTGHDGALVGGTYLEDGRLVLVSADGNIFSSVDDGDSFTRVERSAKGSIGAVTPISKNSILVVGPRGSSIQTLSSIQSLK